LRLFVGFLRLLAGLFVVVVGLPPVLALFGFAVPLLDLLNHGQSVWFIGTLVGLIFVLLLHMGRLGLSLAAIGFLASAWTFVPEWASSLPPRPLASAGTTVLKVMTHNIFGMNYDMERMARAIAEENPDIIALQEFFPPQAKGLSPLLAADYPYSVHCFGGKRANLALFSKFPFDEEMTPDDCPSDASSTRRTGLIIAVFKLADGSHFSVMTTHMDWPYPIERQAEEFAAVEQIAKEVEGPLILVGDFNSTPWSYALKGFEADTGLRRETRNLVSFPTIFTLDHLVPAMPILPLDQVFQRGIVVHELHTGHPTGSDHLPVFFTFSLAKEQNGVR
jgi:endonuclease/exonuclease/phosphatase (EEP) superfamily protein YafD